MNKRKALKKSSCSECTQPASFYLYLPKDSRYTAFCSKHWKKNESSHAHHCSCGEVYFPKRYLRADGSCRFCEKA